MFHVKHLFTQTKDLVEIFQSARARPASVAARPTGTRRLRRERRLGSRSALGRHGEHGELRLQLLALALRALGFLFAEDQSLELVLAFLADVLEDGHEENSAQKIAVFYLKSKRGHFANPRPDTSLHTTPLVARRTRANRCQLLNRATFSSARARGAAHRSGARRPGALPLPLASGSSARADHHRCARARGVERVAVHACTATRSTPR